MLKKSDALRCYGVCGLFAQLVSKTIFFMLQSAIYVCPVSKDCQLSHQCAYNVCLLSPNFKFTIIVVFCIKTQSNKAYNNLTPVEMGHCIMGLITNISVSCLILGNVLDG